MDEQFYRILAQPVRITAKNVDPFTRRLRHLLAIRSNRAADSPATRHAWTPDGRLTPPSCSHGIKGVASASRLRAAGSHRAILSGSRQQAAANGSRRRNLA